ncbi:isocitrate/isopropylmalate family dehydrogenase [Actinophytocola sp.]|uniref:isocitrate/isopropylmalate family dehydrogenase n=1 Tax=Actinophytocola sp. TaxID=1872138 RepID=UPI003D6B8257
MTSRRVTLIPGDGIGPEIVSASMPVLHAAAPDLEWDEVEAGESAYERRGVALPNDVVESVRHHGLCVKGPMGVPMTGYTSPNSRLRAELGLWCNVRVASSFDGARTRFPGTEIVIIRDVTEDTRGAEQPIGPDAGVKLKFITRRGAERVARYAYSYALHHGLNRVTVANQAPTNRATDGLFLAAAMDVAEEFPDLKIAGEAMDVLTMHLALDPLAYQILLCPSSYGGVLAGLCSGITGGVGMMPGFNTDGERTTVFEPGHGNAPKYAGLQRANPIGFLLSGVLLLEHIGLDRAAKQVRTAVADVMREGRTLPVDQGGHATTNEVMAAVLAAMR